jgi:hypothetical protein
MEIPYSTIRQALFYYDNRRSINTHNFCTFSTNKDNENFVTFSDKNGSEIGTYYYEKVGIYYPDLKIWRWAWDDKLVPTDQTVLVRQLMAYGYCSEEFLKILLTSSKVTLDNMIGIDIVLALTAYILNHPRICKIPPILKKDDSSVENESDIASDIKKDEYIVLLKK